MQLALVPTALQLALVLTALQPGPHRGPNWTGLMGGQPDPESNPNQLGILQPDPNPDLTRTGLLGGQVDPICKPNPAQRARPGGQGDPKSDPKFSPIRQTSWVDRLTCWMGLVEGQVD